MPNHSTIIKVSYSFPALALNLMRTFYTCTYALHVEKRHSQAGHCASGKLRHKTLIRPSWPSIEDIEGRHLSLSSVTQTGLASCLMRWFCVSSSPLIFPILQFYNSKLFSFDFLWHKAIYLHNKNEREREREYVTIPKRGHKKKKKKKGIMW